MENVFKLEDVTFPLLIKDIIDTGFTGIVFVSSDDKKKGLIFKEGILCAIQSNRTDELLGHILVKMGTITESHNEKSLELSRLERRKQGVILLEMGIVQPGDITEALRQQLSTRFTDIFSWEHGMVQKVTKNKIDKAPDAVKNDFLRMVRKGIMEHTPFPMVISALSPHADAIPKKLTDNLPVDMGVPLDSIDQFKVSELLLLGQDPSRALLSLYCTGFVSFEESKHKALIDTLRKALRTIKDQTSPFDVLGVDQTISDGGLKRSYIKLVKANHPDTYSYADDPEVKRLANEVFTEIQKAYTTVIKIREGKPPEESQGIDESIQAEILYNQGTEDLRNKNYDKALDNFRLCVKMRPEEQVFMESYVKTLFLRWQNTGMGNSMEIKSAVREGNRNFPRSENFYLVLGWVLKKEGSNKAVEAFRKVLQLNRNNVEAQRELRLYAMRSGRHVP